MLRDVDLAAHHGLQGVDDLRRDDDGIDALPGTRAMRLLAADHRAPGLRARHERAAAIADGAGVQRRPDVQPNATSGLYFSKMPALQHLRRAAHFSGRRAFLGGLEHEQHVAAQAVPSTLTSASATPMSMAVCESWPQACMTPTSSPR